MGDYEESQQLFLRSLAMWEKAEPDSPMLPHARRNYGKLLTRIGDHAGAKEMLPLSQIVQRDAIGPTLTVYRIRDEFRQELHRLIPRNGSAGS